MSKNGTGEHTQPRRLEIGLIGQHGLFMAALQFMTRLPVTLPVPYSQSLMAQSARYYPAVGFIVGSLAAMVFWLGQLLLPVPVAVLLAVSAAILLTGALHEDGLADVADGLGGSSTRERALEIMKDSRIGTYGATALGVVLALKLLCLSYMPAQLVIIVLIAGHTISRAACVAVMLTGNYARDHGTAAATVERLSKSGIAIAVWTVGILIAATAWWSQLPIAFACGLIVSAVAALALRAAFTRRLSGYTGDCLGATQQVAEAAFYLGVLACL